MDLYFIGILAQSSIQSVFLINDFKIIQCPTLNLPISQLNVIIRPHCGHKGHNGVQHNLTWPICLCGDPYAVGDVLRCKSSDMVDCMWTTDLKVDVQATKCTIKCNRDRKSSRSSAIWPCMRKGYDMKLIK